MYLKKYVPSVDIVGINIYGGIDQVHQDLIVAFEIPYLVTEFGSLGEWDRAKDGNGVSLELDDDSKMSYYKQLAHKIRDYYGYCLGGFVFNLGDTSQVSLTWWNINQGGLKKYPYLAMEDFYKDRAFSQAPFVVKNMSLSRNIVKPSQVIDVTVELKNVLDPGRAVEYSYFGSTSSEEILIEYPNEPVPLEVQGAGAAVKVKAPAQPGTYRIYAVASSDDYASTFNRSIKVAE